MIIQSRGGLKNSMQFNLGEPKKTYASEVSANVEGGGGGLATPLLRDHFYFLIKVLKKFRMLYKNC